MHLVVKTRHVHDHCDNVSLCKSTLRFCKDATNKHPQPDYRHSKAASSTI